MMKFRYKVVPLPARTTAQGGSPASRLQDSFEKILNDFAAEGWEYWHTEHLEMEDKPSWISKRQQIALNLLIFRRVEEAQSPLTVSFDKPASGADPLLETPKGALVATRSQPDYSVQFGVPPLQAHKEIHETASSDKKLEINPSDETMETLKEVVVEKKN